MRLDSTSRRDEGGEGTSPVSELLLNSLASMEETSQCVQRLPTTASSITTLPSACTTPPIWSRYTTHNTQHLFHQIRQKLRAAQVSFHLGHCQFPPGCSGSELVHCPARLFSCLSPSILSIPQSYWGIIFCLEMESLWRIHKYIYPFSKLWKTHVDL